MALRRLVKSFRSAARGLVVVFKSERNFKIQLFLGVLALVAAFYFPLKVWEKVSVLLLTIAVLVMEIFNTVVEYFADLLKPRLHHYVGVIKDVVAGAVLITSLGALIVGLIIFLPYLLEWYKIHL